MDSVLAAQLLVLAVAVGANNFAAALALGAMGQAKRWPRIALVFGIMEFAVPLVGIWLGRQASQAVGDVADWLAPALLIALGVWVVSTPLRPRSVTKRAIHQITTWKGLILLSFGLAVDNIVVGISLGLRDVNALVAAAVIGFSAVVFTAVGLHLGRASRRVLEVAGEVTAGLLLIGAGVAVAFGAF